MSAADGRSEETIYSTHLHPEQPKLRVLRPQREGLTVSERMKAMNTTRLTPCKRSERMVEKEKNSRVNACRVSCRMLSEHPHPRRLLDGRKEPQRVQHPQGDANAMQRSSAERRDEEGGETKSGERQESGEPGERRDGARERERRD